MIPFALTPLTAAFMAAALFGAAYLRGYSGFGLSAAETTRAERQIGRAHV